MDPDILIILRGFLQIAWNFWPALVFIVLGLAVTLIWERADRK
jgi:hypothetical protein